MLKQERLVPLSAERVEEALALCDECVGKNLYTREQLLAAAEQETQQFLLLLNEKNEAIAYVYFRLIALSEAERMAKKPLPALREIAGKEAPLLSNLQSVGVLPAYRHCGLSAPLVAHYLRRTEEEGKADLAFSLLWKPNGRAPMAEILEGFGFSYLTDAKRAWYDRENLICPICGGRCSCDAAVYYKKTEGRS